MGSAVMTARIEHVFVLMLENRSFDHMFGFSAMEGNDPVTGDRTTIDGLMGNEANAFGGSTYSVASGADYVMPVDPSHEFLSVLDQLCGPAAHYLPGGSYPAMDGSGFVDSYVHSGAHDNLGEVLKSFDTPKQLPVLFTLAKEFALCDHWYSSLPGPTWPNRLFAHAASSNGLDHSPTTAEILKWETIEGFSFPNGSIYDRLRTAGIPYHFYAGDDFPMVASLKGVNLLDIHTLDNLEADLKKDPFPYGFVFIEPSYNTLHEFRNSSCQHPLADVRAGEALIKNVYEWIRASKAWESSLLIITWDEHGGFYDHVRPPAAIPPGDTLPKSEHNQYGFTFAQYGIRVPAVVVSPYVPRNLIDHRTYDHSSIPATVSKVFGVNPLTARDRAANSPLALASLDVPRESPDFLVDMPKPATFALAAAPQPNDLIGATPVPVTRPEESANGGSLPVIINSAVRLDLMMNPGNRNQILLNLAKISTRRDAMKYLQGVQQRLRAARAAHP
jgi:phospholipase C